MQHKTSPDQFDDRWPLREPREVLGDRKLRFPPLAQQQIAGEGPEATVYWNYDPDVAFVFISQDPPRKATYEFADWNEIENPQGNNTYIRAPAKLPDEILDRFKVEGTHMVYLASPEMLTDDNPSTWVLSWTQFTSLLPEADNRDPDKIETAISRNPGFLPSSPF
ncbi:hypothetical protein PM033_17160 [Halorubrum ezzemoulense]|uniref:hypothetical protein n=1 Tax=Halorubrum ezzemoulense TaxID=337243 RepID=UPI002330E894|nr:hypothetical protein [Halorubrum ezzemoulense]MDB2253454.1 hypothetical protein [Halorubrum ezzemoulense]